MLYHSEIRAVALAIAMCSLPAGLMAQVRLLDVESKQSAPACAPMQGTGTGIEPSMARANEPVFPDGLPEYRVDGGGYRLVAQTSPAEEGKGYACKVRVESATSETRKALKSVTLTCVGSGPGSTSRRQGEPATFEALRGRVELRALIESSPVVGSVVVPLGSKTHVLTLFLDPPRPPGPAPAGLELVARAEGNAYLVELKGPSAALASVRDWKAKIETGRPYVGARESPCSVTIVRNKPYSHFEDLARQGAPDDENEQVSVLAGSKVIALGVMRHGAPFTLTTTLPATSRVDLTAERTKRFKIVHEALEPGMIRR